ncbi:MAG: phospholipase D-like domain-containing protein, partial [Caldimonas sp.]
GSIGSSGHGSSLGRLHTKLSVVDDEKTFVGSMNMDGRSAHVNTEAGIVIRSKTLAALVAKFLRGHQQDRSYQVRLQGQGMSWSSGEGAHQQTRSIEPASASAPTLPIRVLAQLLGDGLL